MEPKRILIIDDEESILMVLKNSLKKLGPDHHVETVKDGFAAIDKIREQPFDLIVTDYNMAEMDGLELMETIRYLSPHANIIMMTAYGNEILESEADRLEAYRYMTKPLEIKDFREVVQEALEHTPNNHRSKIMVISDERYKQVSILLEQLKKDAGGRCLFLADLQGNVLVRNGNTEDVPIEEISSLLGGGIATLHEAGRRLDGDDDTINLAYRESPEQYLYALNVNQQLLLILVIDRTAYSSRLGTVWYYVQQVALDLRQIFSEDDGNSQTRLFEDRIDQAFDEEMDKLFTTDDGF